jgi:septal ring factor EnvC (AmiA/AmiB activator)
VVEDTQNGLRLSLRDIAGWVFRIFITVCGAFAAFTWNRITSDIEKVQTGVNQLQHQLNENVGAVKDSIASQNVRIAVIENTTKRTEHLVEQEQKDLRAQNDRLSKVEGRCCK